jgi:uncharacterized protein with HEPN domain
LPENLKKKYSKINWKQIAGTRDILIHFYFGVQTKLLMKTIENDLPDLKKNIKLMIKEIKNVQK